MSVCVYICMDLKCLHLNRTYRCSSTQGETGDPWCLLGAWGNNNSQCNAVQPGQHRTGRLSRIMSCFLFGRWTLPLWQNTGNEGTHAGGEKKRLFSSFIISPLSFHNSKNTLLTEWDGFRRVHHKIRLSLCFPCSSPHPAAPTVRQ